MEKIVLVGFGGHAKSVIDTIEQCSEFQIVGFSDVTSQFQKEYRGYKVICSDDALFDIYKSGIKYAFITIGYMGQSSIREKIYNKLKQIGFIIPVIIDKSAIIARDVILEEGTFVGKNVVLNSQVYVNKLAIINTGAIIEHECNIGQNSHIAGGSILCGNVTVCDNVFVGAGSKIIQNITVGSNTIIGAGSVVLHNVKQNSKVYGLI